MCNLAPSTETHHLEMQSNADREGFIDGTAFHKNHKANLMALCEACHQNVHHGDDISVLTVDSESAKASSNGVSSNTSNVASSNASKASKKKVVRKKTTKGYSVFVDDLD
jgi:hypothetical protein